MSTTRLQDFVRKYPFCSALISLASLFAIPLSQILFPIFRNPGTLTAISFGLGCAMIGLTLGGIGVGATSGEPFANRAAAFAGVAIGAILALIFAAMLFLILTPNAPL